MILTSLTADFEEQRRSCSKKQSPYYFIDAYSLQMETQEILEFAKVSFAKKMLYSHSVCFKVALLFNIDVNKSIFVPV